MTENQAKRLIKIGKILVIFIFAVFLLIITIQSVKISNLNSKYETLTKEYNEKQNLNDYYNNEISNIENNFNKYSEEELRKDNFIKENETFLEYN